MRARNPVAELTEPVGERVWRGKKLSNPLSETYTRKVAQTAAGTGEAHRRLWAGRSTTLRLPAFGFGAAHLGELYGKVDEADSRATLDAAWDAGIRYYDTAPWYGRGLSEHRLGGFLRTKPRDEFIVTTKVGRTLRRPKDPSDLRPRAMGRRPAISRWSSTTPMTASCAPTSRRCSGSRSTPSTRW